MTFEPSQASAWQQTEFPWMSFAAGSPAKTLALLETGQALSANGRAYGAITPGLLARYDPDSSSWRTSQHSFFGGLETFSETWPRSGMMRSGIASQLPPLALLTGGTGCGSSRISAWPTPTADKVSTTSNCTPAMAERYLRRGRLGSFIEGVAARMWPTPAARDYRFPNAKPYSERGGGTKGVQLPEAAGGPLNPRWVEWLMGFPLGWTDCGPSATPSSRKSRS